MSSFSENPSDPQLIARLFGDEDSSSKAWKLFESLGTWSEREKVVQLLHNDSPALSGLVHYKAHYRTALTGIIRDDFYTTPVSHWAAEYAREGEINVPLLDPRAIPSLVTYSESVEPLGKRRYGQPRPCYPPGEVALKFAKNDPRSLLYTEVNMVAVGSGHMATRASEDREMERDASSSSSSLGSDPI